jgi:hypothetical protein
MFERVCVLRLSLRTRKVIWAQSNYQIAREMLKMLEEFPRIMNVTIAPFSWGFPAVRFF